MDTSIVVSTTVRCGLSVIMSISAISKAAGMEQTRASFVDMGLPPASIKLLVPVVIAIETGLAALLIVPDTAKWGAALLVLLLLAFTALITANLLVGRNPTCNCFGALSQEPINWKALARNAVLMGFAVSVIFAT